MILFFLLELLCFPLRALRGPLMASIALRAGIALGRVAVVDPEDTLGVSERACLPSVNPSCGRSEAKKSEGNAITRRCTSKERRAASQGDMNQNIAFSDDGYPLRVRMRPLGGRSKKTRDITDGSLNQRSSIQC